MLTEQDLKQIAQKGITEEQINEQLNEFKTGFPFLKLKAAASIEDGIVATDDSNKQVYIDAWTDYKKQGHKIVIVTERQATGRPSSSPASALYSLCDIRQVI